MKTLAVGLILALAPTASADIRLRGKSGQDRRATLRTDDAGTLERFGISWRAPCRKPGYRGPLRNRHPALQRWRCVAENATIPHR